MPPIFKSAPGEVGAELDATGLARSPIRLDARASVWRAIKTLQRQQASLNLRYWAARKRETPEERARVGEQNMRRIHASYGLEMSPMPPRKRAATRQPNR